MSGCIGETSVCCRSTRKHNAGRYMCVGCVVVHTYVPSRLSYNYNGTSVGGPFE